jgi:hypothetical protein
LIGTGLATPYKVGGREIGGFDTKGLELKGLPGVFAMGAAVRGEWYAVHSFPALAQHTGIIADKITAGR